VILYKFHIKFFNTLPENSTGQLKTEVRLTRFNNVHIICLKQFHKKLLTTKSRELRSFFLNGQASRPYSKMGIQYISFATGAEQRLQLQICQIKALAAQWKERLDGSVKTLKLFELSILSQSSTANVSCWVKIKVKEGHTPKERRRRGCSSPFHTPLSPQLGG